MRCYDLCAIKYTRATESLKIAISGLGWLSIWLQACGCRGRFQPMSTAVQSLVFWSLWRSSRTILNSARELPYGEQIGSQTCCRKHRSGSNQGHTATSSRTRLQWLVQTQHTSSSPPSAHLAGVSLRERNSDSKSRKTFRCKVTERELGF